MINIILASIKFIILDGKTKKISIYYRLGTTTKNQVCKADLMKKQRENRT